MLQDYVVVIQPRGTWKQILAFKEALAVEVCDATEGEKKTE